MAEGEHCSPHVTGDSPVSHGLLGSADNVRPKAPFLGLWTLALREGEGPVSHHSIALSNTALPLLGRIAHRAQTRPGGGWEGAVCTPARPPALATPLSAVGS